MNENENAVQFRLAGITVDMVQFLLNRHHRNMSKSFLIVSAAMAAVVLAIAVPNFIRARATRSAAPCINNLRQFDAAKNEWALENHKTPDDMPAWKDLSPYLSTRWSNTVPICPDGGIYTLGRIRQLPTCSLGDTMPGHKLAE